MPTLTLAIPSDLKVEMDSLPEINWSEIARKAIATAAAEYKLFKCIAAKSKLSEAEALKIGSSVNEKLYRAYAKKLKRGN